MADEGGAGRASRTPPTDDDASLKAESLVLAEFSRASENAQQVRQERTTMLGHYLAVVGAVFAAVTALSTIFEVFKNQQLLKLSLFGLFLVFGCASVSFFDRELGLNLEWRESLRAVQAIKAFYAQAFKRELPDIKQALRLRTGADAAANYRGLSATSYMIAAIGSLGWGNAAYWGLLWGIDFAAIQLKAPVALAAAIIVAVIVLALSLAAQIWYYRSQWRKHEH
jgi:hypothetical protein